MITGVFAHDEKSSDKNYSFDAQKGWEINSCGNKSQLMQSAGFSDVGTERETDGEVSSCIYETR